jgi:hypothetical protein
MKKKTIVLLCCLAVAALAVIGVVFGICLGRETEDAPDDDTCETIAGTNIKDEDPSSEETDLAPDGSDESIESDESVESFESDESVGSEQEPASSEIDDTDQTDASETDPDESSTSSLPSVTDAPETEPEGITYDEYYAMSSQEQEAYFKSFPSVESFFAWYNAAKEKYLEENPGIEIGPGGSIPIP